MISSLHNRLPWLWMLVIGSMVSCTQRASEPVVARSVTKPRESVEIATDSANRSRRASPVHKRHAIRAGAAPIQRVDRDPTGDIPIDSGTSTGAFAPPDPAAALPDDLVPKRPVIDTRRLRGTGIRKLEGKHLVLYTDLPASSEVDELPRVFDLAVPQWCTYFNIDPQRVTTWKMTGYLMRRKEAFQRVGLVPPDLPPFLNGFQLDLEMWVYDQPSAYYRRHLMLHEGTHAFMHWHLGGAGPPWYMEGMAELMGTHRWREGRLRLGYFPRNRDEVEHLGRIRIIRDEVAAGRALSLDRIRRYDSRAHLRIEPYGWCWAACALLDGHPQFQRAFRQLPGHAPEAWRTFAQRFHELLGPDMVRINEQWQLFIHHIDYGYDLQREAIQYTNERPLPLEGLEVKIRADRGWQSTGIRVESGATLLLEAAGRYQIARASEIWWCEPGGVTIRYYGGRPLGILLGAITSASRRSTGPTALLHPESIGRARQIRCVNRGILFLRVNDWPSELADNDGHVTVRIRRQP